jgi:hypothetical protein
MMAVVILVCSLILMLQFFVSYCRSLIAASAKEPLPLEVQEVTGISHRIIRSIAEGMGRPRTRAVRLFRRCHSGPAYRF